MQSTGRTITPTTERLASGPGRRSGPAPHGGPAWRALLEARWRNRLEQVTELSLAYHDAAAGPLNRNGQAQAPLRRLLRRAVAARRALADTDEALGRLAAGRYGRCERCWASVPAAILEQLPEARYCRRCASTPAGPADPAAPP